MQKTLSNELSSDRIINKTGFYISIAITALAIITFGIAINTPPLSGPLCKSGCFQYPYLDIVSRFPSDYYWMYPAIILYLLFLPFMICLYNTARHGRRLFGQISVAFAGVSSGILIVNYFVQTAVIQPSLLNNEFDGISILSQYNPHGVFIALEEIGFLTMSISFLCMAPIFLKSKIERALKRVFYINFVLALISFIVVSLLLGLKREYIFEIAVISFDWIVLIIAGILSIFFFHKRTKSVVD